MKTQNLKVYDVTIHVSHPEGIAVSVREVAPPSKPKKPALVVSGIPIIVFDEGESDREVEGTVNPDYALALVSGHPISCDCVLCFGESKPEPGEARLSRIVVEPFLHGFLLKCNT